MKKRRIIEIFLVIAAVFFVALMGAGWRLKERRQEEAERQEWLENSFYVDTLTIQVEGTNFKENIKGWHDWTGGRFYIALPSYAAGRTLMMDWRFADELLIDGEIQKRGRFEEYELNREYDFCFPEEDGYGEQFTVVFLCSANLPSVFVNTESGSMDYVNADKRNRESGMFFLVEADGTVQCEDNMTYIKGRGNTTWEQDKKPYSVKLKNSHDIMGMGEARRWELLANAYDGSNMRNQLVLEMAQEAGMQYTPEAAFTDLFLNGEYQGLYQIAEKVETGSARVAIDDHDAGKGDLTGGYLFLMEDAGRYENVASRFMTAAGQTMVIKSPGQADDEEISYISGLVQEFEDAITAPDGIHPKTGKAFTEYIDLDSFVRKYLVEEITKNSDAVTNSQYFYKQADAVSTLLFAGPVWDYDNALGHTSEEAMDPVGLMLDKVRSEEGSNLWYGSLCSQPVFQRRVKEVYREVFAELLADMSEEKIDAYRELLRVSATLDWIRWKDVNKDFRYRVCDSYDEYVDYLQNFVRQRKAFLDSVYLEGEVYKRVRFDRGDPFGYEDLYTKQGSPGRQAPDSSDIEWEGEHITGWFYEDGTPYDPGRTVEEDITVYARWEPAE